MQLSQLFEALMFEDAFDDAENIQDVDAEEASEDVNDSSVEETSDDFCAFLDMHKIAQETLESCAENNYTRVETVIEIIDQINKAVNNIKNRKELETYVNDYFTKMGIAPEEEEMAYLKNIDSTFDVDSFEN